MLRHTDDARRLLRDFCGVAVCVGGEFHAGFAEIRFENGICSLLNHVLADYGVSEGLCEQYRCMHFFM